ncbi:MAG TPA: hypothetical protein VHO28_00760 [Ignavibacteriales bacterium]|nr:hypothetical protein [Ignavibacteriales bacterium]
MKKTVLIILALFTTISFAQSAEQAQKTAMQKLSWLIGEWHGTSETNLGGGKGKSVVDTYESARYDLDSMLVIVYIKGSEFDSVSNTKKTVNNDFVVISYDAKDNTYEWRAWKNPSGSFSSFEIKPGEKNFESGSKVQAGQTRFVTALNEQGQLTETGSFSRDGEKWVNFKTGVYDKVK